MCIKDLNNMSKSFICPVCSKRLPFWFKLSSIIECKHCHSGLKLNGRNRAISLLLLIPFLAGVIKAFNVEHIFIYALLSFISFLLILFVLLTAKLKVVYAMKENPHNKAPQPTPKSGAAEL
jgi:hypothetical protein